MQIVARTLKPSKAHARRDYVFITRSDGVQTLTIRQGWRDTERYKVEETHESGAPGRVFLLCKQSSGEVYECFLAANGQDSFCSCDGVKRFKACKSCKHTDALRDLLEHGDLPHPYDNPGIVSEVWGETPYFPDDTPVDPDAPEFPGGVDPWAGDYL